MATTSEFLKLSKYRQSLLKVSTNENARTKIMSRVITNEGDSMILGALIGFDPSLIRNISPKLLTEDLETKHSIVDSALSGYGVKFGTDMDAQKFYSILPKSLQKHPVITKALIDAKPEVFKLNTYKKTLASSIQVADQEGYFAFIPNRLRKPEVVKKALESKFGLESMGLLRGFKANKKANVAYLLNNDYIGWGDDNIDSVRKNFTNRLRKSVLVKSVNELIAKNPRLLFTDKVVDGQKVKGTIFRLPKLKKNQELILGAFNQALENGNYESFVTDMPIKGAVKLSTIKNMINYCQTKDFNNNMGVPSPSDSILGFMKGLHLENHKIKFSQMAKIIEQALSSNSDVLKVVDKKVLQKCFQNRRIGNKLLSISVAQDPTAIDYAQRPLSKRQSFMVAKSCIATLSNRATSPEKTKLVKQILNHYMGVADPELGKYSGVDLGESQITKRQTKFALKALLINNPEYLAECVVNPELANMRKFKKLVKTALKKQPEVISQILDQKRQQISENVNGMQIDINKLNDTLTVQTENLNVLTADLHMKHIAELNNRTKVLSMGMGKKEKAIGKTEELVTALENERAELLAKAREDWQKNVDEENRKAADEAREPLSIPPFNENEVGVDNLESLNKAKQKLAEQQQELDALREESSRVENATKTENYALENVKRRLGTMEKDEIKLKATELLKSTTLVGAEKEVSSTKSKIREKTAAKDYVESSITVIDKIKPRKKEPKTETKTHTTTADRTHESV